MEAQLDEIETYCANHNIQIPKRFEDTQSATKLFQRPGLTSMFDAIELQKPDFVIATESDRISRNLLQFGWIDTHLSMKQVKLLIINEKPPEGPFEKAFIKIRAVFSEFETDLRQYRIDRGRKRAIEDKRFMHRPPLGYRLENGKIVVNEDAAMLVRQIFEDYKNGVPIKAIARKTGKNPASIRYILRNPFYWNSDHHSPHKTLASK